MREVTDRQMKALQFIYDYLQSNGWCPNYREIMQEMGHKAIRTSCDMIYGMEHKGLLEHRPCTARAIKITPKGMEALSVPTNALMEIALAASALLRQEAASD